MTNYEKKLLLTQSYHAVLFIILGSSPLLLTSCGKVLSSTENPASVCVSDKTKVAVRDLLFFGELEPDGSDKEIVPDGVGFSLEGPVLDSVDADTKKITCSATAKISGNEAQQKLATFYGVKVEYTIQPTADGGSIQYTVDPSYSHDYDIRFKDIISILRRASTSEATDSQKVEPQAQRSNLPPIGQCYDEVVKSVSTRIDGEPESGSVIEYTNGKSQVSEDAVTGIQSSKPGDNVRICVTALPENCPPGDNRGITYNAINKRTNQSWTEADSDHMCGGA